MGGRPAPAAAVDRKWSEAFPGKHFVPDPQAVAGGGGGAAGTAAAAAAAGGPGSKRPQELGLCKFFVNGGASGRFQPPRALRRCRPSSKTVRTESFLSL